MKANVVRSDFWVNKNLTLKSENFMAFGYEPLNGAEKAMRDSCQEADVETDSAHRRFRP
ncbi:hypothetical protein [Pseudomonas sp. PIC25]|uniref:hypothetical protein n=1 Tax=Pseudomonas sp. PIC25 TaxID=1958773 RepID=UPI00143DE0E6|nr:hypothetical protein [Pseudomonas sp. PIC25]